MGSGQAGGVQGKLLHFYSLVLTRCFLASYVGGKFDETLQTVNSELD